MTHDADQAKVMRIAGNMLLAVLKQMTQPTALLATAGYHSSIQRQSQISHSVEGLVSFALPQDRHQGQARRRDSQPFGEVGQSVIPKPASTPKAARLSERTSASMA